jgi:hypothetical protein
MRNALVVAAVAVASAGLLVAPADGAKPAQIRLTIDANARTNACAGTP